MSEQSEFPPIHPNGAQMRGVRAAGKARSRQRLMESAKQLFMERGYEGATVRDIAAAAGLSTGAVFASFQDKLDLFNEVLLADSEVQITAMSRAAEGPGPVRDRLLRLLSAGYEFHLQQLELLRAGLAVSWSNGLAGELRDRPVRKAATEVARAFLEEALAGGELRNDIDVGLLVETLWDCYVANYRYALFGDWGLEQLRERLGRQIDLLLVSQLA